MYRRSGGCVDFGVYVVFTLFVRILSERFNINEEAARRHFRNMYEQKKALMIKPLNETISKLNEIDREEPGKLEKMLAEQNEKK